MSEPINDGGPAFPMPPVGTGDPRDGMTRGSDGMSLRDWFAGMALQGFVATLPKASDWDSPIVDDHVASSAYRFADAMIAQREKKS